MIRDGKFDFIFGPHGSTLFILDEPHECAACHAMKTLFVARPGIGALCLICDNPRREQADYDAWLLANCLSLRLEPCALSQPTKEAPCSARPAVAN